MIVTNHYILSYFKLSFLQMQIMIIFLLELFITNRIIYSRSERSHFVLNNSDGGRFVVPCCLILYANRNLFNLSSNEPLSWLLNFNAYFNVWINGLANHRMDAEWNEALCKCLLPIFFINSLNSLAMNCGQLSDTNCFGIPY